MEIVWYSITASSPPTFAFIQERDLAKDLRTRLLNVLAAFLEYKYPGLCFLLGNCLPEKFKYPSTTERDNLLHSISKPACITTSFSSLWPCASSSEVIPVQPISQHSIPSMATDMFTLSRILRPLQRCSRSSLLPPRTHRLKSHDQTRLLLLLCFIKNSHNLNSFKFLKPPKSRESRELHLILKSTPTKMLLSRKKFKLLRRKKSLLRS